MSEQQRRQAETAQALVRETEQQKWTIAGLQTALQRAFSRICQLEADVARLKRPSECPFKECLSPFICNGDEIMINNLVKSRLTIMMSNLKATPDFMRGLSQMEQEVMGTPPRHRFPSRSPLPFAIWVSFLRTGWYHDQGSHGEIEYLVSGGFLHATVRNCRVCQSESLNRASVYETSILLLHLNRLSAFEIK
jgi:hypothetical protein